jgi:hypothetical protein
MPPPKSSRAVGYQFLAGCLFLSALALVQANVEAGMNDDWSFIYTVRQLAQTGHLHFNGWSAPLIGVQAYWAALFVRLFGFSFLLVRSTSWLLTLGAIPVLWHLLRSIARNEKQAFFGLLAFLFSPLTLPNLATFMTDMPAFFLFAAALLAALKAWAEPNSRKASWWITAVTVASIFSGSVRQIYWLGGVCLLVTLAVLGMRTFRSRLLLAACIAITLAAGAAGSVWLAHQPYIPADITAQSWHESSWQEIINLSAIALFRGLLGVAVLCLPLSAPLAYAKAREIALWLHILIIPAAFGLSYWLSNPMPWVGNTLTNYGVISNGMLTLGDRPLVLSQSLMLLLSTIGITSAVYAAPRLGLIINTESNLGRLCILTMPFLFLYALVIAWRGPAFGLFDRYLIPHLFMAILVLLGILASKVRSVGPIGWAFLAIFAAYALATTHDYFAEARAKLQAAQQLLHAGHKRDSIMGGFEFDSWTQVERHGHLNNQLLKFPPGAYVQRDDCNGSDDTQAWWLSMTPAVKARYVLTLTPLQGLQPSGFAPVKYQRWLPWARFQVYVQQVPENEPPLTCAIGTGG